VVGWEVCCRAGWKEEEVNGWRVRECKWLSAKPADKTEQNQPEREILANGTNPEICKRMNNKPKCTKPELPKNPSNVSKQKKVREKQNKIENKTAQAKALHELAKRRMTVALSKWLQ